MSSIPHRVRRAIGVALLAVAAAQTTAAAAVMTMDHLRKRRQGPPTFPRSPVAEASAHHDEVTVYSFGEDLYADMLAAIDAATDRIYFETFIWKGDEMGRRFKRALIDAADRGVEVYVVYDAFANIVVDPRFFSLPGSIHVKTHPLVQSAAFWNLRYSGRDHRKLLVIDGEVAFMGGYNIGSLYADSWRDTHGRFTGPCVAEFEPRAARRGRARLGRARHPAAQRAALAGLPDPQHVPRGDRPGPAEHLAHDGLSHPRR